MPRRSAATSMKASSVNGDGSFIAHETSARSTPSRQRVHVVGVVDDGAAGAEQLEVDRVHVEAAVDRVARDQRDRGRAAREQAAQALVVVGRRAEADELALRPGAAAVHRRVDAARVVGLAGIAERSRRARRGRRPCRAAGSGCPETLTTSRSVPIADAELALPARRARDLGAGEQVRIDRLVHARVLRVGARAALARVGAHAGRDLVHRAARVEHLAHAAREQHLLPRCRERCRRRRRARRRARPRAAPSSAWARSGGRSRATRCRRRRRLPRARA